MKDYKDKAAILLFSGGQDSTTCMYWAKKHFGSLYALIFSYGQRHIAEVANAQLLAKKANVPYRVIDANFISQLAPNALTNLEEKMDAEKPSDTFPNTFVPGRNLLFLTIAGALAYSKDIEDIIIGVSETDYSGYPDCRNDFIRSAEKTLSLAMNRNCTIHTPLMKLDKAGVWQLADELGVFDLILNETITCYNGLKADGCGHCPACILRKRGLEKYLASKQSKQRNYVQTK